MRLKRRLRKRQPPALLHIINTGTCCTSLHCKFVLDANPILVRPLWFHSITIVFESDETASTLAIFLHTRELYLRPSCDAGLLVAGTVTLLCAGHGLGTIQALFEQRPESCKADSCYSKSWLDVRIECEPASIPEEHNVRFQTLDKCESNEGYDTASCAHKHKQIRPEFCRLRHIQMPDSADR